MTKHTIIAVLLFFGFNIFGQSEEERKEITKEYDLQKLNQIQIRNQLEFQENYKRALELAGLNGWNVKIIKEDGTIVELVGVTDLGMPIYHATENEGAAVTTRTVSLYPGGVLGLNLTGQGMTLGLWEVDATLPTHSLFEGRVTQIDTDALSSHASHVAGTILGGDGVQTGARGMAYEAQIRAFNSSNDEAELTSEAANGMLISSHSYGIPGTSVSEYYLGKYDNNARDVDEIMYNAPYYLGVFSAGNDRNDGINTTGYDLLTDKSCNKNGMTVAAVQQVTNYTGPGSVVMSSFSSWGPTDDGRIKPDISAKGVSTYSASSTGINNYYTASGTSMATPNVSGTLLLLQQHYHNEFGSYMRSSTLRGLVLHTADEAGNNIGPDYEYGWGLLNAEKAATVISNEGGTTMISELTLTNGQSFSIDVFASNVEDLQASITWTDPEGTIGPNIVNDPTPVLVHDLDLRITQNGNTFYPWKLNPAIPSNGATQEDNMVDNIEKIEVSNAAGMYTITVTHKGTLSAPQTFSLIVTGLGDCNGEPGGTAYIDTCGTCVEGTTGLSACVQDCYGDFGGNAYVDSCGTCAEGNTGFTAVLDPADCGSGISEAGEVDFVSIYPNPTPRDLNIYFSEAGIEDYTISLRSVEGKMVYERSNLTDQIITLDLDGNSDGIYILTINSASKSITRRIVLSH